ncbi:hypothetical protein Tco_0079234 [Tanacetum coccineum]
MSNNNNNCGNRNNSRGNNNRGRGMVVSLIGHPPRTQYMARAIDVHSDTGTNSHVTPDLAAMEHGGYYWMTAFVGN